MCDGAVHCQLTIVLREAELGLDPSTVQGDVTDCDGREPQDEAWTQVRSGTRRAGPPETAIGETGKAEDKEE